MSVAFLMASSIYMVQILMMLLSLKPCIIFWEKMMKKMMSLVVISISFPFQYIGGDFNTVPRRYFCGGSFCFMSWCLNFFVLLVPYVCFHIFS